MAEPQTQAAAPRASTLLVDWREPRLLRHVASPKHPKKDDDGNDLAPEARPTLVLKPGINSVDAETWKHAVKSTLFKHYLETESLVVVETKDGKTVAANGLDKLTEKEAVRVVKATNTEDLLEGWRHGETRAGVLKAIDDQVKKLADAVAPPPPKQQRS